MIRPRVGAWLGRGGLHPYVAATLPKLRRKGPNPLRGLIVALCVVGALLGLVAGFLTGPVGALVAGLTVGVGVAIWAAARNRRRS